MAQVAPRGFSGKPKSPKGQVETREVPAASRLVREKNLFPNANHKTGLKPTFANLVQQRVGALLVGGGAFFFSQLDQLVSLAARHAVPSIYTLREFVELGGLMSYGARIPTARLASTLVGCSRGPSPPISACGA